MKVKIFNTVLLFLFVATIFSCKKDDFVDTANQVGVSKVTYFPIIALKGSSFMELAAGSAFTDPGVDATVNGADVTPTISGSVDAATPGIYYLKYTATNADGFSASANRIVIVKSASPVSPDYSGNWQRNAGALGVSRWIQLTPTTYAVSDPGGANYTNFWCIATLTGATPKILAQQTYQQLGGALVNINTTASVAFNGTAVGSKYSWTLNTPGFGTSSRTFVKQ
jgi:hypothetical protein